MDLLNKIWDWDAYTTEFTLNKNVVIRSKSLKVPFVICGWLGVFCMFGYYFIWCLRFMKTEYADGNVMFDLRQPHQLSWKDALDPDIDAPDFTPNASDFGYCQQLQKPRMCGAFDEHDIHASHGTGGDMIIATRVEYFWQKRAQVEGGRPPKFLWEFDTSHDPPYQDFLVTGVENYEIKMEHEVKIESDGIIEHILHGGDKEQDPEEKKTLLNSETLQGYTEDHEGNRQMIPCKGRCDASPMELFFQEAGMPSSSSSLYSNGADFVSLQHLLKIAGVDLDKAVVANESHRSLGMSLEIVINYDNMDRSEFWTWPFGRKPKYTYRIRRAPYKFGEHVTVSREHILSENTRLLVRYTGILLQAKITGNMGSYSLSHIFISLTVIGSFLTILKVVMSAILVRCYAKFGKGGALIASQMFQFYQEEKSLLDSDFEVMMAKYDNHSDAAEKLQYVLLELLEQKAFRELVRNTSASSAKSTQLPTLRNTSASSAMSTSSDQNV
mmetsp:Transcript_23821/g.43197  ORF Transcript_23821/g.43197 Transcript_23821/m.43197 type:complete len:497 (+) Transcript_23821:58-1548(+)|eukprot:CAMPEP_0197632828 /NCGR_PEP_ID=MMETSP1338-20131121/9386_1 /TAXON_ID=43686 ORGANISM="Pelagodinium beii, Strain RCC1491" /NCGR_SAMPLE_ID=MMETSP1338 /ASSEMBLY_ACC=CAM_ASM_000754 /LENGTH=496 /DNA_ID=CAMNT_0043204399 /DNA_START=58 /DNA_END=1548 /DNA_ORIENTATION=-